MPNIVYALTNQAMPGLVQIGMTDRDDVRRRTSDLYTTGGPRVFKLLLTTTITPLVALATLTACSGPAPQPPAPTIAPSTVSTLFASGPGEEVGFTPIPVGEPLPTLTEDEIEKALSIIKESGVVKTINGNQDWTYELVHSRKYGGFEGTGMDVVWNDPVASSGPWALTSCQGTRRLVTFANWSNITRLALLVDLENEEMVTFVPMGEGRADQTNQPSLELGSQGDKSAKVYDMFTKELLFEGTKDDLSDYKMCSDGKEDEEGR